MGLQPDTKLEFVEDAYIRAKKFEQQMKKIETTEFSMRPLRPPKFPMMEPEVGCLRVVAIAIMLSKLYAT